jgi:hypothetical protein
LNLSVIASDIYIGAGYGHFPGWKTNFIYGSGNEIDHSGLYLDGGVQLRLFPHFIFGVGISLGENPDPIGYSTILYDLNFGIGWAF